MIKLSLIALTFLTLTACNKADLPEPPKQPGDAFPEMLVTELNNREVTQQQSQVVDLNKDGVNDVVFSTWAIGDPVEQEDEILFFAATGTESSLMIGGDNMSPRFSKNETIAVTPPNGYEWYIVAQVELALKNIGNSIPPYWEKDWKDVSHKFLAVQVKRSGLLYHGWIELTMDTINSKLILHRAAIARQAGRAVRAGI
ncbi:hypothetical protein ACX0G7_24415 [Flavitalea antarctica]